MKVKKTILQEAIDIFEGGEAERRRVAKMMQKTRNSNNLGIVSGTSVIESYEALRETFSDASVRQPFDKMLLELRTVFINDNEEVEGPNTNENIESMTTFLVEQANRLRENGLKNNKEHKIDQLYTQYVDPSTAVNPTEGMKKWMQPKVPRPDIITTRNNRIESSESSPRENSGLTLVVPKLSIPKQQSSELTIATRTPTRSHSINSLGEAITPRGKRKGLRSLLELRPHSLIQSDPEGFEIFFKSFAQLDSMVWSEIREVARDESIPPEECGQRLVDLVIRDKDSPWRIFYQQIHNAKTICSELQEILKKLEDTREEANSLRETNILNQAFLTGDMAQSLMDEIAVLQNEEIKQRLLLSDTISALEKASQERDEYTSESRRICQHLAEAQSLLKKLQMVAADCFKSLPEGHGVNASQVMERIDKVHLSLVPDSGAPSGKRCSSCLQVCTLSPFCSATGRPHVDGDEYSSKSERDKSDSQLIPKTPSRPFIIKTKSNLARKHPLPSTHKIYNPSSLCVIISATAVLLHFSEPCTCGLGLLLKRKQPTEITSNQNSSRSQKPKGPVKASRRARKSSKAIDKEQPSISGNTPVLPEIEPRVVSNVRVKDEFNSQDVRSFLLQFERLLILAGKTEIIRNDLISICKDVQDSNSTEMMRTACESVMSVFGNHSFDRKLPQVQFGDILQITKEGNNDVTIPRSVDSLGSSDSDILI